MFIVTRSWGHSLKSDELGSFWTAIYFSGTTNSGKNFEYQKILLYLRYFDAAVSDFSTDVAYFDGVSEIIITVGLVKPKPGVFQDFVHYLLILATPTNIVVLGVTFSQSNESFTASEEMHITQEVVYTLPTDGVMFSTIVGTENGRIFMGAKDGCLYEFVYQVENFKLFPLLAAYELF